MHRVDEWRCLHKFEKDVLERILSGLRCGTLGSLPEAFHSANSEALADTSVLPSRGTCFDAYIKPAFSQYFDSFSDFAVAMAEIEFRDDLDVNMPHTRDDGPECNPVVVMAWKNSPEDLMCLAHEVAHALQVNLSAHEFMPPVAREVCAFLGELILLDWTRGQNDTLFDRLRCVWTGECARYFGEDAENLLAKLSEPGASYQYRINYPLARVMAVHVFVHWSRDQILDLFSSGSQAMSHLPFEQLADMAAETPNYLPPFPPPSANQPALDAYRSLGAMALLDLDCREGESEKPIGDYYSGLALHLKQRSAFVALGRETRPIGYATWARNPRKESEITLMRQAAPFGDCLELQQALAAHLSSEHSVLALHERSARTEQVAG